MYNIFLKTGSEQRRDMVMKIMDQAGIETRPVFYPMHVMPPYAETTQYPVADSWACRGINLPTHEGLTESCVKRIANHLNQAIRQTSGLDTNFTARAA
jgi:perosamine synthetase